MSLTSIGQHYPLNQTFLLKYICAFIFQYNRYLSQVFLSPTHNRGNIFDLVIVSNDEIISDILIHSEFMIPIKSDHYPVTFMKVLYYQQTITLHTNLSTSFFRRLQ